MLRTPVSSSYILEVGYEPASMTVEIAMKDGSVYQYFDVPETVYQELMHAGSIGTFLNSQIKNNYRYVKT